MISKIENIIDKLVERKTFGPNFLFRRGQREAVVEICSTYLEGKIKTIILDAPTGTGKSIVAMVASSVLTDMGKRGYLVTSDTSLQDQYEADFIRFGIPWASIKGVDNYVCVANGQKFSLGECRVRSLGYEKAKSLPCYNRCGYFQNRQKAIDSRVSLLNYSYWLIQRNYVAKRMEERGASSPFDMRDFIFFDEAHKVDEIIQSHFSPKIDKDFWKKISDIRFFLHEEGYDVPVGFKTITDNELKKIYKKLEEEVDKFKLFECLELLESILGGYVRIANTIKEEAEKEFPIDNERRQMPASWRRAMYLFDWVKDLHCKIEDYTEVLTQTGTEALVKRVSDEDIVFQCLEESHLLLAHFHNKAPFKVLMSATFGNHSKYARIAALKEGKVIRLKSEFDFKKSPVYSIKKFKLNYKERDENLPKVVKMMDAIIEKRHESEKGIIHAGSYDFVKKICRLSKHKERFFSYTNSSEKKEALKGFYKSETGILIGPSILEGLDLKDDRSRFQMFFKVPFPSLSDPLIKEKLKKSNDWYDWKTSIGILQGIGRSVRSQEDWAVTYFLDACFDDLVRKEGFFPSDFLDRIIRI
jgi:ATP-dependent DNA helicase DinG